MTQPYSIDTFPRTLEACNSLTPSQRFGYMNRLGALRTHEDKQGFGAADAPSQAQALLEAFMSYDQQRQNGQVPPAQPQQQMPPMQIPHQGQQMAPQQPQMGVPQMPAQPPQMAPMAPPQAQPYGQPPPQQGFAPPQMPMPGAPPMPQQSYGPPAAPYGQQPMGMPPQMPPQMAPPPMAPPQGMPPQMAPPQMGAGMPLPGQMPLPNVAPPMAPPAGDGREPAAPTGKGKGKSPAATGDASAAILKKLTENNEEIINTLSSVANGSMQSIEALQNMHQTLLGIAQVQSMMLVILVEFAKAGLGRNLQDLLPTWYQALHGNEGQQVIQYLSQQPGKG